MDAPDFIFNSYDFDAASGALNLRYAYAGGPEFIETITFPSVPAGYDAQAADCAFRLIFLLAGVSYYKARVPRVIRVPGLGADEAAFFSKVYRLGLGEFAHRNGLTVDPRFPSDAHAPAPVRLSLPDRALVPVGGGKDSVVSIEALRGHKDMTLFALGGAGGAAQPIADTIRVSGLPHIYVSRTLAPALLALNKQGAYNGHVPITAILSAIAVACAVLYGYRAVVLSNERSASAPNFGDVNHQYSKSLEFERDFSAHVAAHVSPDIQYFSLLRLLSEIDIARRFAAQGAYHAVFRSCNTAFRQDEAARGKKWCCNCPKCRFVFLALAPFVEREKLAGIFGSNMLDDAAQIDGFAELVGASAHKPFECVGEVEESARALAHLAAMPAWAGDAVIKALAPRVGAQGPLADLFAPADEHFIPPDYLKALA